MAKQTKKVYYRLDNAGQIYPASRTKKWSAIFRISIVLKDEIQPDALRQAVADLAPRFPTYYVQLKSGFMWDYLEPVTDYDVVEKETDFPCRPLPIGYGNKPMFRVIYNKNRIALELFHCLTDGNGALIYVKTLAARYLEILGHPMEYNVEGVLDWKEAPKESEIEDSFQKIYSKDKKASRKEANAYQLTGERQENYLRVIHGLIPVSELKVLTKAAGVTITEYLVAVYCYAFYKHIVESGKNDRNSKKPIRISVPANLRPMFESETLRNFAMFSNVDIYPSKRTYTFEDILDEIRVKMRQGLDKDVLHNMASQNVAEEKMLITKMAPNVLKQPIMKIAFKLFGENKYTSPFSNLGLVKVPRTMEPFVDRFEFVLGETTKNTLTCSTVSYGDLINVSLSCVTDDTKVQRNFFTFLTEHGVNVKVESNI